MNWKHLSLFGLGLTLNVFGGYPKGTFGGSPFHINGPVSNWERVLINQFDGLPTQKHGMESQGDKVGWGAGGALSKSAMAWKDQLEQHEVCVAPAGRAAGGLNKWEKN